LDLHLSCRLESDPKRAIGRLKGDNLVRQNHLVSFHEIFGCQLPRRYPSLLLQQSYEGTSVPGIDYQVASSATISNTRSTITGEDRDNITPHNAIKTNTTHQDLRRHLPECLHFILRFPTYCIQTWLLLSFVLLTEGRQA
jgi:hypothetical protein